MREVNAKVVFVDLEVGVQDHKIHDIGAVRVDGATFHSGDISAFRGFLGDASVLCGHNIVHHDMRFLAPALGDRRFTLVDTLYWSPLLFPERSYHALLKDDKLLPDELNNPVSDAKKAMRSHAWRILDGRRRGRSWSRRYTGRRGGNTTQCT